MKPLVIVFLDASICNLSWESFNQNVLKCLCADLAVLSLDKARGINECEFWKNAKFKWALPEEVNYSYALENKIEAIDPECGRMHWDLIKSLFGNIISDKLIYAKEFLFENIDYLSLGEIYSGFIFTNARYIWQTPHPPLELLKSDEFWFYSNDGDSEIQHVVIQKDDLIVYLSTLRVATFKYRYWQEILITTSRLELLQLTFRSYLQHCFSAFAIERKIINFPSIMFSIQFSKFELKRLDIEFFKNNQKTLTNSFELFSSKFFSKLISSPSQWKLIYKWLSKNDNRVEPSFLLMDRLFQTLDIDLNVNQINKLSYDDSVQNTLANAQNECHLMVRFVDKEAILFDSRDDKRSAVTKAKQYKLLNGRIVWRLLNGNTLFLGLDSNGRFSTDRMKIVCPPLIVDLLSICPIVF